MNYVAYWKSDFEKLWRSLKNEAVISNWDYATTRFSEGGNFPICEIVYQLSLPRSAASIIVFSSVDISTERTRKNGADAVRIIYEWNTRNGLIYAHYDKRLRIETMLQNLRISIVQAATDATNLKQFRFGALADALKNGSSNE